MYIVGLDGETILEKGKVDEIMDDLVDLKEAMFGTFFDQSVCCSF